jgi:hypothetical protein
MTTPKRKRGRPKKPRDELQTSHVYVRMTAAEKELIDQASADMGQSEWARNILTRAARRQLKR